MEIDILSLIVGMVLWELLTAYEHFVVTPKIRRIKEKRRGDDKSESKKKKDNYTDTSIGFNCKLD